MLISPDGFPYDPRVVEFRCFRWWPFSQPHLGSVIGSLTLLSFSPTFAALPDHEWDCHTAFSVTGLQSAPVRPPASGAPTILTATSLWSTLDPARLALWPNPRPAATRLPKADTSSRVTSREVVPHVPGLPRQAAQRARARLRGSLPEVRREPSSSALSIARAMAFDGTSADSRRVDLSYLTGRSHRTGSTGSST